MKLSERGVNLLIEFEGFRPNAYIPVPGDVPTIGFGFTRGVKLGDEMTLAEAKERLKKELAEYERGVLGVMSVKPSQAQFDACVVFAFNVGVAGFRKSSVLKNHNRGDFEAAARSFGLWNKSGGKVYRGLTRRRAAEAALYLSEPETADAHVPMPQTVEPERPLTASSINRASLVAGGTASVAAATEVVNAVNGLKTGIAALGDWVLPLLLVGVVALCAYTIWERRKQREGGWA